SSGGSPKVSDWSQQTCPFYSCLGLRRSVTFDLHQWTYQRDLELDLFATQFGRGGQGHDLRKRTSELFGGFNQRRALHGLLPRFAPPFDGSFDSARLGEVVRQQFGLGGSCERMIKQCFGDAAMQNLAPALKQIFVGRVLDEGVFKAIICVRWQALHQQNV